MARIKRMAWGTIARWLESAATYAVRFNDRMLRGFVIHELQADEIRTFVGAKKRVIWVLTTLEVWSRLWVSTNVGRRSLQQIKNAILNTLQRGLLKHRFLFTSDGFEMYEWAAKRLLLGVCIYGQVIKSVGRIGWFVSIADCFSEHKANWKKHCFIPRIPAH